TARRLPARQGLPIAAALLARDGDLGDPYIPLLCWWALEHHLAANRDDVLALFEDPAFWDRPMVFEHILPRLMRRFAAEGRRQDLLVCASLLRQAPAPKHAARLLSGFEEAFRGRVLAGLPGELVSALPKAARRPGRGRRWRRRRAHRRGAAAMLRGGSSRGLRSADQPRPVVSSFAPRPAIGQSEPFGGADGDRRTPPHPPCPAGSQPGHNTV